MATIKAARPEMLAHYQQEGKEIPKDIPPHFLDKSVAHIEDIGEPTNAAFLTKSDIDPTNWYFYSSSTLFLFVLSLLFFTFFGS